MNILNRNEWCQDPEYSATVKFKSSSSIVLVFYISMNFIQVFSNKLLFFSILLMVNEYRLSLSFTCKIGFSYITSAQEGSKDPPSAVTALFYHLSPLLLNLNGVCHFI